MVHLVKDITDMEAAQTFWERMKGRMVWCRNEATIYLKTHPRKKHYKIIYSVDSGEKLTYAALYDDDIRLIRETIENDIAENGPYKDEEERVDAMHDILMGLDLYWDSYIPIDDLHCNETSPSLVDVNFDDVKYFCLFKVKETKSYNKNHEDLNDDYHNIEISDDEFVDLVAAKLFDKKLTFYDLRYLHEDLYKYIEGACYTPHRSQVIFMKEINEIAQAILNSKSEEELPEPIRAYYSSLNTILNNQNHFNDKFLIKSLNLAMQE